MPSESVAIDHPIIESQRETFTRIASREKLVHWAEESQFVREAMTRNPSLQNCTAQSLQEAIINVATCGLSLNPISGLAYLVPEYNKQTRQNVCQLRISFKGLCKVAIDSGAIHWVRAEVVREKDAFEYRGPCREPQHRVNPFSSDRGDLVGVYCIAKTASGDILCDVMGKSDIDKIRATARTDKVWLQWYEEMAKKALIKRASKLWPSASNALRFQQAVDNINQVEGNVIEGEAEEAAHYPDADFQKFLPQYQQLLETGKRTVDDIINMIELRAPVSPQQRHQLHSLESNKESNHA